MTLILTVIHIMAALALIFVVLVQKGSGADMGAAFGGSSQSLFGARGSGSFLGKLTAVLATVFMVTSLTLAFFTTRDTGGSDSVMQQKIATTPQQVPAPTGDPQSPATPTGAEIPLPPKSGTVDTAAQPPVNAKPIPGFDDTPAANPKPVTDSKPAIDSKPVTDSKPAIDSKPVTDSKPATVAPEKKSE
ncbi:MAG: preprotein translocase subunit SecG [Magnetococcales bacterium]|nr:preprotein translocase subunit SecG [Magnetococcales bacterium]